MPRSWDDKGNIALYNYVRDDGAGINQTQAHEANRTSQTRVNQIFLKEIQYKNLQPFLPGLDSCHSGSAASGLIVFGGAR
jgi:hypothetical protein